MNDIDGLTALIKVHRDIVFFGGAGVSTESGIPDFRSANGLYTNGKVYGLHPEELLSYEFFSNNPELFFRYYKKNLVNTTAQPNKAHIAIAKLERLGSLKAVITQNIDGLHQLAGSRNVLELHGSNLRYYCMDCKRRYSLEYILREEHCTDDCVPICRQCGGVVRPDVVLYGEGLNKDVVESACKAIASASLLIIGGTALVVEPAAGLIKFFRGRDLVIINASETPFDGSAQLLIRKPIGEVFGEAAIRLGLV